MKPFPLFHDDKPALFLAPLAGLTHSPFRRLLSDFGSYSALYSEMLSGRALFGESFETSTYIRRRPEEGKVVYQLQLNGDDPVEEILSHLIERCDPWAIDLNLGCPAPAARKRRTGSRLFLEHDEVENILTRFRSIWKGPMSVKSRLGSRKMKNYEEHYFRMIEMFEQFDLSWYTLHPRFTEDELRRGPYYSWFPKITERSSIPLIGNGDIRGKDQLNNPIFESLSGIMIGRAAVCRPWIFRELSDPEFSVEELNYGEIWNRLLEYVNEEFIPTRAIGRMKQFTTYYQQNFKFGHTLYSDIINDKDLTSIYDKANRFFDSNPEPVKELRILQL